MRAAPRTRKRFGMWGDRKETRNRQLTEEQSHRLSRSQVTRREGQDLQSPRQGVHAKSRGGSWAPAGHGALTSTLERTPVC